MAISTPAKVGAITLTAFILLGMMIIWKTEIFLISKGYQLTASFDNIEGLTIGSEVRFRGLKVGKITKIDPGPYDIKIFAVIEPNIKIPIDSSLRVAFDGIVGMKYLEVKPGISETMYTPVTVLKGMRTSSLVDFIDIGAQNLMETKAILSQVRMYVEDPRLQESISKTMMAIENTAIGAEKLTEELRQATEGVKKITTDPKFQENVKGTIRETEKTLSSANRFFENISQVDLRTSGGVDIGTRANAVRGDIDIIQSEKNYFRLGLGEGPSRQLSLLDFIFTNKLSPDVSYRIGVINNQLGGGVALLVSDRAIIRGDIYDINNETPTAGRLWPKVRLGYQYEVRDYMDLLLQADNILNGDSSNMMVGIRVKPPGEKLY